MHLNQKKGLLAGLLVTAALAVVVLPALAAPAALAFQVSTDHKSIVHGNSLRIIPFVKQSVSACTYTVTILVTGPGGVSATQVTTITTLGGGNGQTAVTFPGTFSGTANTNTAGTYSITATFVCGYSTGTATNTFTVT